MKSQIFLVVLVVTLSGAVPTKKCFPGNQVINCLLNTCTIYKKCPGDPTATCRIKRTECGCEANWYKPSGEIAYCDRQSPKVCPGGEKVVRCDVDLCSWPCNHPDFVNAPCKQTNCGKCAAEYFVKEKWITCPTADKTALAKVSLPQSAVGVPGSASCKFVECNIKICINKRCPLEPRAVCRPDGCNECKPAWYLDGIPVQCYEKPLVSSTHLINLRQGACAKGKPLVPCDQSICDGKICRNYPEAVCRPDGCGKCKDTWFVGEKQVDCLSDECPADVPYVKCPDDPCKHFAHYCPDAVCRASQCGSCEAKFYANGVEVDCTMPPKVCPAGVKPRVCKWFTCPNNVCPSDKRLMCRIDPCGPTCRHDWVDIYNGEIMTCRTFDGDGRTIKQKSSKIFYQDPMAKFFTSATGEKTRLDGQPIGPSPEPQHPVSVITGNAYQTPPSQLDIVVSRGPGRFRVEPIFVMPRQVISTADLYALLNAYEHELMGISSLSIQNALRTGNVLDGSFPPPAVPLSPAAPLQQVKLKSVDKQPKLSQQIVPVQQVKPKSFKKIPTMPLSPVAPLQKMEPEPSIKGLALPGILGSKAVTSGIGSQLPVIDKTLPLVDTSSSIAAGKAVSSGIKQKPKADINTVPVISPHNFGIVDPVSKETLANVQVLIDPQSSPVGASSVGLETMTPVGKANILTPTVNEADLLMQSGIKDPFMDLPGAGQKPVLVRTSQTSADLVGSVNPPVGQTGVLGHALDITGAGTMVIDQQGTVDPALDQSGRIVPAVGQLGPLDQGLDQSAFQNQAVAISDTFSPGLDQSGTFIPAGDQVASLVLDQSAQPIQPVSLAGPFSPSFDKSGTIIQTIDQSGLIGQDVGQSAMLNQGGDNSGNFNPVPVQSGKTNLVVDRSGVFTPIQNQVKSVFPEVGSIGMPGQSFENPGAFSSVLDQPGTLPNQQADMMPIIHGSVLDQPGALPNQQAGMMMPIMHGSEGGVVALDQNNPIEVLSTLPVKETPQKKKAKSQPVGHAGESGKGVPISMTMFQQWGAN